MSLITLVYQLFGGPFVVQLLHKTANRVVKLLHRRCHRGREHFDGILPRDRSVAVAHDPLHCRSSMPMA